VHQFHYERKKPPLRQRGRLSPRVRRAKAVSPLTSRSKARPGAATFSLGNAWLTARAPASARVSGFPRQLPRRDRGAKTVERGAGDLDIGARCKIASPTFICTGVEIEDEVFVGHGTSVHQRQSSAGHERGAALGAGANVMGDVRIGAGALVGAGAVFTPDVASGDGHPPRASDSAS
jgi:hypothetical protein